MTDSSLVAHRTDYLTALAALECFGSLKIGIDQLKLVSHYLGHFSWPLHLPTAGDIGRELADPVGDGEGLTPPVPGPLSLLLQSSGGGG